MQTLNPAQREAVVSLDGPVLVLAGAGTGKTRALTARLAYLLYTGKALPGQIMAVTFTNKAAAEVRERVSAMLGRSTDGWYLGTFHALAARLLRPHAELIGLKPNFTILDEDDQLRLIKQLLNAENVDDKRSPARLVLGVIERWKDRGLTPDKVPGNEVGDLADGKLLKIYRQYQERLQILNACDFGDLLLHQLTLLQTHPDILAAMQRRFQWLLVDEYQDTNVAQYLWLRLLAQGTSNICCVGDEDQSIYGWRGAEVDNILRFADDFPGAKIVRLEQNYRSTGHILGCATRLIDHNHKRLGKSLWTEAAMGQPVRVQALWDGEEEARFVGDEIEAAQHRGTPLSEIAIMVRAGFQTRQFEERLLTLGIPYRVLVGARFYERQEIRDALAYLRVVAMPQDDLALERIINVPKRGFGPAAMQQLMGAARAARQPLFEVAWALVETDELKPKLRAGLRHVLDQFTRWRGLLEAMPHHEVAQLVLDESGYTAMWQADKSPEAPGRLENLKELISAMAEFETLPAFLEHVSLVMEQTEQAGSEQVSIMTLHGAKGLEYDLVFLPGWEEEIFPSRRSIEQNGQDGLEEERRLAYVGITRAKQRAFITYVANRFMHGSWLTAIPSRFIGELPKDHSEHESLKNSAYGAHQKMSVLPRWTQQRQPVAGAIRSIVPPSVIEGVTYHPIDEEQDELLCPGQKVFHQKFGYGIVRTVYGDKLDVEFETSGLKKIIARFVEAA